MLRAAASAIALCTAFAAQAAPSPVAPACTAAAANPTWADCAGDSPDYGDFYGIPVDASSTPAFDGDGAPVSSIDFTTLGVSVNPTGAGNGRSQASIYATSPLAAIPEPHTNLLMLAGLAAMGFMATRRRRP